MFSLFFIRRPIVACVISILIVLLGMVAYPTLPVAQYPSITPPVIQVSAVYPGASAQVVADTVASPIEQQVNGVDGMLYMESTSASDGSYVLKITFEVGTNIDIASVLVQNRVSIATPKLPEDVRRQGVTTDKVSSNIVAVCALVPDDPNDPASAIYTDLYLSNYLVINVVDEVNRIDGVGDTNTYPAKDYGMRIWLDPEKLQARSLTTTDVVGALREQNVQVAAGVIGQPPVPEGSNFQFTISTLGRLNSVDQFENVIVKTGEGGRLTRLKDVARVELGAKSYDTLGRNKGVPCGILLVYQAPGGNSVQVAADLRKLVERMDSELPPGLIFSIRYDTSKFVNAAVDEVFRTLYEAIALVLLVVLVFLGSIRATIIPILTIPVALIGTFVVMKALGFSINLPTLFGLILAIGIVVDDAIVVVENVERNMSEHHLPPKEATRRAMVEVFGAVVGISLVLMAVFLPTAVLPGISGSLYQQFAVTIAASTFFSAVNALTLSPALCGVLLKPHVPSKKPNWFNRGFNAMFDAVANAYAWVVRQLVRPALVLVSLALFGLCIYLVYWSVNRVPTGFLPNEDRGLIVADVWLPDAASQERTLEVIKKVEQAFLSTDGVQDVTALQGFSIINGAGSNYGVLFSVLEDWDERLPRGRDFDAILRDVRDKTAPILEAIVIPFGLPPIEGLGNAAGFEMRLQDRAGLGRQMMQQVVQEFSADGATQSKLAGLSSAYRAAVPQLFANIDREKVKQLGIPLQSVFDTLSAYLGSSYVNDFNLFGRTWQVSAQAEAKFRASVNDITQLEVRSGAGQMIPLRSLLKVDEILGPDRVVRYNLYPAASLNGAPARGVSSGEALEIVEQMAAAKLPQGMGYEWTSMAYQEKKISGQGVAVFAFALIVVYLILAGLYESWTVPLAVILSIPMAVLGAMLGLMWRGMDNNIYTQIGLVLLVGLGAKNAILIVEFARENRSKGKGIVESAVEASRQRLRPILMTAFAFILGVLPLVNATGAGGASRQAIGTAVFFGMIGNTALAIFFTPVLYVVIQGISEKIFGPPKPLQVPDIAKPQAAGAGVGAEVH